MWLLCGTRVIAIVVQPKATPGQQLAPDEVKQIIQQRRERALAKKQVPGAALTIGFIGLSLKCLLVSRWTVSFFFFTRHPKLNTNAGIKQQLTPKRKSLKIDTAAE